MSETQTGGDLEMLQRYARDRAEDDFAGLVRRHISLVYSAALRHVRSPQLAEEVSQSVFTDLARNAGKLKSDTVLTAWLYQVACRSAIDVVRREARRQLREQIACEMNATNSTEADWTHVEPLLDEAMSVLDDTDRTAVLLRYFENQSLREVGQQFGVSDDTAQKRVSRAVEKLRDFFAKRGVTVGAGGLAVIISANAVQAAPVGLAVTISAAALAGTAASTSTIIAATKTIAMTTLQKTVITAAFIAAVGVGIFEARQAAQLREQNQTLQQQRAPLAEQIQQLQRERDDATNRLASLTDEIAKINGNNLELLRLRGQVGVLRNAAQAAAQTENDPTVQLARVLKEKEAKLRQLFEQRPDQKIPEMHLLDDTQWLSVAEDADLESARGIRLALSRTREVAILNFAASIQQALHTYMNANNKNLPVNPSQLARYFKPPIKSVEAMLSRYVMIDKEGQNKEGFKGASIIQQPVVDATVDNALIVGVATMGFAPKPNQGHAPVDIPRELLPVLKSYMDANNHKTPLDFEELKPYITTSEQTAALEKFIKAATK